MARFGQRVREIVDRDVSARSLGLLRIFACAAMLYRLQRPWAALNHEDTPVVMALGVLFLAASMFAFVGFRTGAATKIMLAAYVVLYFYYGKQLGNTSFNQFHPLHVTILLALTPCGRSLSVDRVLAVRRARAKGEPLPSERVQWLYLELFVLQICIMYFWAGSDKLDAGWISGERLERIWMHHYATSDALAIYPWLHPLAMVSSWFGTLTEFALIPLLAFRRTRGFGAIWGVFFHLSIFFSLNAPHFTMLVLATYFACLPPDKVERAIGDVVDAG